MTASAVRTVVVDDAADVRKVVTRELAFSRSFDIADEIIGRHEPGHPGARFLVRLPGATRR